LDEGKVDNQMKRFYVVGVAFAAMLAFSMVSASGASAFSLWDQCTKTASPLEFSEADCITKSTSPTWGWEEIKAKTATDSLVADLILKSGSTEILCEGSADGFVGPGNENEVTELLNTSNEPITSAKPVTCTLLAGPECTDPVTAYPVHLPWLTLLEANSDLLEGHAIGKANAPGWFVKCSGFGQENECVREDTNLSVENLLAELEVDLTFPPASANELAECTNFFAKEGEVHGTVSILLVNGNALRAM